MGRTKTELEKRARRAGRIQGAVATYLSCGAVVAWSLGTYTRGDCPWWLFPWWTVTWLGQVVLAALRW